MSWRIVWTSNATSALQEMAQSREDREVGRGVALVDAIFDRVDALRQFPWSAPRHPRAGDERIRRLVLRQHIIVYRVIEVRELVEVLAIRHQRQRPLTPDELP